MSDAKGTAPEVPLVLIVEDSATETHVYKTILQSGGYRALAVADGAQALPAARKFAPDLVLMDVVMPRVNGFKATRELRRNPETSHIPVVMISSKDGASDRTWGLRQGARDYLVKPISSKELLRSVRQHLGVSAGMGS